MKTRKKHWILKIIAAVAVLFLIAVGVVDWVPNQTAVEKTVIYENR